MKPCHGETGQANKPSWKFPVSHKERNRSVSISITNPKVLQFRLNFEARAEPWNISESHISLTGGYQWLTQVKLRAHHNVEFIKLSDTHTFCLENCFYAIKQQNTSICQFVTLRQISTQAPDQIWWAKKNTGQVHGKWAEKWGEEERQKNLTFIEKNCP